MVSAPFRSLRSGLSLLICSTIGLWVVYDFQLTSSPDFSTVGHVRSSQQPTTSRTDELPVPAGYWKYSARRGDDIFDTDDDLCQVDQSEGAQGRYIQKENALKRQRVASWEWAFNNGTALAEFDWRELVRRAVQSRYGIIFIGDSINNQLAIALKGMINPPAARRPAVLIPSFTMDPGGLAINQTTETLFESNDFVNELMEEFPKIPRERFKRPIITVLPSDHLVTNSELVDLMKRVGVQETLQHEFRSEANWMAVLDAYDREGGWEGELPGYIIFNTGAHWSPAQIKPTTNDQLLEAYEAALQIFKTKLNSIAKTLPHRVIFRSTAPGHPDCQTFHAPQANATTTTEQHYFGWHLFQRYNEMARRAFAHSSVGERPISYWNVWDMSIQRPDAHLGWKDGKMYDCLHWCKPSVPEWWWKVLWHTLQLEEGSS